MYPARQSQLMQVEKCRQTQVFAKYGPNGAKSKKKNWHGPSLVFLLLILCGYLLEFFPVFRNKKLGMTPLYNIGSCPILMNNEIRNEIRLSLKQSLNRLSPIEVGSREVNNNSQPKAKNFQTSRQHVSGSTKSIDASREVQTTTSIWQVWAKWGQIKEKKIGMAPPLYFYF